MRVFRFFITTLTKIDVKEYSSFNGTTNNEGSHTFFVAFSWNLNNILRTEGISFTILKIVSSFHSFSFSLCDLFQYNYFLWLFWIFARILLYVWITITKIPLLLRTIKLRKDGICKHNIGFGHFERATDFCKCVWKDSWNSLVSFILQKKNVSSYCFAYNYENLF